MMQGAAGDMSNRNYRQGHDAKELVRTGEGILAQLFASQELAPLSLDKPVVEPYLWETSYPVDKRSSQKSADANQAANGSRRKLRQAQDPAFFGLCD